MRSLLEPFIKKGDHPIIWSIAGSDCSSAAGIQADLKTASFLGCHCCTVITSVTAQNTTSVYTLETVSERVLKSQIDALEKDLKPAVIKIGLVSDLGVVRILCQFLADINSKGNVFVVYDPVLTSSSNTELVPQEALQAIRRDLFPFVNLLTPNLVEAEKITQKKANKLEDIEQIASELLSWGVKSVLIKGGHWSGKFSKSLCQDYFTNGSDHIWLSSPRKTEGISSMQARGTGCTLSSAIAATVALGFSVNDALIISKTYLNQCMRLARKLGGGPSILDYQPWHPIEEDFPWVSRTVGAAIKDFKFKPLGNEPIGFYPIVSRSDWLKRLLPLNIRTAQIRIKDLRGSELEEEIRESIRLAKIHHCRLFINDYWDLALKYGAYGVHLGQEDVESTESLVFESLARENIRLGISTHSFFEVARAHSIQPSYMAIGPIFPTTLKSMKFPPQGVQAFHSWRQFLNYPLVAIGGITIEKAKEISLGAADGIAVVSDITQNNNPEQRALDWLKYLKKEG